MAKPKIEIIAVWNYTPHDNCGNVYSYYGITDTRTGRTLFGRDLPESNLQGVIYDINGGECKPNYFFVKRQITKRELKYHTQNVPFILDPVTEFRKMVRARKWKA